MTWEMPAGRAGHFDMCTSPWLIFTEDSRELLPRLPDGFADHVITDPPYDKKTHEGARTGASADKDLGIDFDAIDGDVSFVGDCVRLARRWVLATCAMEQVGAYRDASGESWIRGGFWHKPDAMPQVSGDRPSTPGECMAIMHRTGRKRWNGGGFPAFWSVPIERSDRVHPTQKPLALILRLVEQFTDPGDVVLDPFCGSGTTGVACLRLGRRFVGVERDPRYAALAHERLLAESSGLTLRAARAGQITLL